ncbi:hypothetical protein NEOLEDRAFT_1135211 [Neolentinus lepideus HHB14362 ss-1]|uniref:Ig-like domain-containing protein n=1 Tax=Neolentinus lepideus HHB14362 ss-1 TaxID=1314782 RepID=A0A165RX73_9AGAM|nr:hypothetical protein NEOLEDRAFT_1135211 [Neolentinus lepideus HHB14362 ss-1]
MHLHLPIVVHRGSTPSGLVRRLYPQASIKLGSGTNETDVMACHVYGTMSITEVLVRW